MIEELYQQKWISFNLKIWPRPFFLFHRFLFASWHNRVSFFFYMFTVSFSSSLFTS